MLSRQTQLSLCRSVSASQTGIQAEGAASSSIVFKSGGSGGTTIATFKFGTEGIDFYVPGSVSNGLSSTTCPSDLLATWTSVTIDGTVCTSSSLDVCSNNSTKLQYTVPSCGGEVAFTGLFDIYMILGFCRFY